MHKLIDEIKISNFKFFPEYGGVNKIKLDGKHLLLYGENGAGKSSIFWSLYTLLECSNKIDKTQIQKYFDYLNKQNLLNINASLSANGREVENAYVELSLVGEATNKYRISFSDLNINEDNEAKISNYASDFINYKGIYSAFGFRHRDKVDLFDHFRYHVFPYIKFRPCNIWRFNATSSYWESINTVNANEIVDFLENGPDYLKLADGRREYNIRAAKKRDNWNRINNILTELNDLATHINTKGNEILTELGYENIKFRVSVKLKKNYHVTERKYIPPVIRIWLEVDEYEGHRNRVHRLHSFLNEAKLTAVSLAIRFAILERKPSDAEVKILVLDDLMISLDMSNREKVLELILNKYQQQYQLLIFTHDKSFFEIIKHKIKTWGYTDWKYLEMFESTEDSAPRPYIKTSDTYLEKAEMYFTINEYEIAGNFLRKEAEAFCKEFLPRKYHYTKDYALLDLNGLIIQCKNFAQGAGLTIALFDDLDGHRKFVLNPTSHDSYDVPKFKNELANCLITLKEIRKIKSESFLKRGEQVEFELTSATGTDTYKFEIILEDDFRLLKEEGKDSVLSKGMVNYYITHNGTKSDLKHGIESIQGMYEKCYAKSEMTNNPDFWEAVIYSGTGAKLNTERKF